MLLDILIPSNGQLTKLQPLLESISSQTLEPDRILILIHKKITKEEQETLLYFLQKSVNAILAERLVLLTHHTTDYEPGKWRGYDRNVLFSHAKARFVRMIDHDNVFSPSMFSQAMEQRMQLYKELGVEVLLSPTILRRKTMKVQSQGITRFSYLVPKYVYNKMGAEAWQKVSMIGGNSLFGLRTTFEKFPFDERFGRCYEDVDMTYRVSKSGIPLIVLNKVEIHHMESSKTALQKMFLGSVESAYERARNRIWFVKKNATFFQKIQYFCFGLWIQTGWFFVKIVFHRGKQKFPLLQAVVTGTKDGLMS